MQDEINLKRALESLHDIIKRNYKMKIYGIKTEAVVCSEDPENINIKMDDDTLNVNTKIRVPR
jgi:hypothetical protein